MFFIYPIMNLRPLAQSINSLLLYHIFINKSVAGFIPHKLKCINTEKALRDCKTFKTY